MARKAAGGETDGIIHPIILSGGAGTRLWPLSRAHYPKQLLPLVSGDTMLQETARRVHGPGFAAPLVICNDEHRFIVAEQLRALDVAPRLILLEPEGRNTAPAAAVAALILAADDGHALMLVLPSDHAVAKPEAFRSAAAIASAAAAEDALVTFGIAPGRAETGYGYMRRGEAWGGVAGCFRVASFAEKPDAETAARYLASGDYEWNSGMFLFRARAYLDELERLHPAMVEACRRALADGTGDLDFFRLDADAFAECPSLSIDYAVMEHTEAAAVVPVDMGWSDVGAFSTLWEIGAKDEDGNVVSGDVLVHDVRDSYIRGDGKLVAAVGLEDAVVVITDDAVLVTTRERAQDVKVVAEALKASGREEHRVHTTVYRPWGHYRGVDAGTGFQVKRLTVNAGARLSLQRHRRRAEHWVVVSGTARVTRGDEVFDIGENQSTYIPLGVKHRLENPGTEPLHVIEVQSGDYLGEDDIERFDDAYGRS
ncbi:MAG: mannose-1-phosphate guanylyltransferase/mannose-6-phosphate isomerase [Rhodospirillales bacterium]|jgi:mannose-1-phosphate guanylyltransferase/mannose-6-phosphate isomerase|nr:mannose-1-phosphate guanylyltransferase/mannose-6-phosphate isomerase [Rhodospirillales bacterium]MDP6774524.1 mannose-1-phosphate guanylyltransferase/mannose-6-phosphate isomerase [Rhodospirillales bacterium]